MRNKTKLLYVITPLFLASTLVGCNSRGIKKYRVKFNCVGIKENIPDQIVVKGKFAKKPNITPTAKEELKIFDDYYLSDSDKPFNFMITPITSDITIDARVKDYTHKVTFDTENRTKEGTRTIEVLHGKPIPTKELEAHTLKDEDGYFYSWLVNDEWLDETAPVINDISLKAGIINNSITFTSNSFNLDILDNKSTPVAVKASIAPYEWGIVPGYESFIEIVSTSGDTCSIKVKSDVNKGCTAKVYALANDGSKDYIGVFKVAIGSYNKLNLIMMEQGIACKSSDETSGDIIIPTEFYYSNTQNPRWISVTSIGENGFSELNGLNSVCLSDNIVTISDNAFKDSTNLTNVTINDGVAKIGDKAFYGCYSLTNISIPRTVTSIGKFAFVYSGLTNAKFAKTDSWTYSENKILVSKYLLDDEITAAKCLTSVYCDDDIQRGDDSKPLLNMNSVKLEINEDYESHCNLYSNQDVMYASSKEDVATIEDGYVVAKGKGTTYISATNASGGKSTCEVTVNETTMLEDRQIDATQRHGGIGVKYSEIGNLTYLGIPETIKYGTGESRKEVDVTAVGLNGFQNCSRLNSVYLSNKIASIGSNGFADCSNLKTVLFSTENPTCKTIGAFGFGNCYNLSYINMPDTIEFILNDAFYQCGSLLSARLPESLKYISEECFYGCSSLKTVVIPVTVESIQDRAFEGCGELKNVYYLGTKAQYTAIVKKTDWAKDTAFTVVHCSDGDIAK